MLHQMLHHLTADIGWPILVAAAAVFAAASPTLARWWRHERELARRARMYSVRESATTRWPRTPEDQLAEQLAADPFVTELDRALAILDGDWESFDSYSRRVPS